MFTYTELYLLCERRVLRKLQSLSQLASGRTGSDARSLAFLHLCFKTLFSGLHFVEQFQAYRSTHRTELPYTPHPVSLIISILQYCDSFITTNEPMLMS